MINYATRSGTSFLILVLGVIALQTFATGPREAWGEMIYIFQLYNGQIDLAAVPTEFQYLIEGILPNAIGSFIYASGMKMDDVANLWWSLGILTEIGVLFYLYCRGHISPVTIVCMLLLTTWVKESLSWIGKPDPYVLAALFMAAFLPVRSRIASSLAIVIAVFCHPPIAVLGTFGIVAARSIFCKELQLYKVAVVIAAYIVFKIVMALALPDAVGRDGYMLQNAVKILVSGVRNFLPFMTLSLAVPAMIWFLVHEQSPAADRHRKTDIRVCIGLCVGLLLPALVACFLVIDNTRIFTLATLPFMAVAFQSRQQDLQRLFAERPQLMLVLVALALFTPELDQLGWNAL